MKADITNANGRRIDEDQSITRCQEQIAAKPLTFCPDFPEIADRFEAWWRHETLAHPIFIGTANGDPARPITRRLELLHDSDAWFNAKLQDLKQTKWVGDALPAIRVDFGAATIGGLVGANVEFGADTAWTHESINDEWSNEPDWQLKENEDWWRWLNERTERVARHACGQYLVCTPDLGGGSDALANMRGPQNLCIDAIEKPERIRDALSALYPVWRRVLSDLYDISSRHHAGLIQWLGLWSNSPYTVITCDFNALIGPADFQELFVPDITRQASTVDRAVFHLDGPDATRHIDALLDIDPLDAIQFTPGAGTPSAMPWVPMFEKILHCGRALLVICPLDEVLPLCRAIGSNGVAVMTSGPEGEVDEVYDQLRREHQSS